MLAKKLEIETCIDGLKEIILDVLVEAKRTGECLGPTEIASRTGIADNLSVAEGEQNFMGAFTLMLLSTLKHEMRAQRCTEPGKEGKWELTAEEFQKRFNS